jgi:DNA-directed RNA polymerase specialized sigma24 family protein
MKELSDQDGGDKPVGSPPDFRSFVEIVEELLAALSRDGRSWRVPEDAVDRTYDKFVDRVVDGSPPANPRSWAWRVLTNLFKSGPERTELRSAAGGELPGNTAAREPTDERECESVAARRQRLEQLGGEALLLLTEPERTAFQAMLTQPTMAAAARTCGMTRRDLRVRRKCIARKIRALLDAGPPARDSDSSQD